MVFASCFRCGKVFGFLLIKLFKRDECFYIALAVQAVILASFTADSLNFHGDTWQGSAPLHGTSGISLAFVEQQFKGDAQESCH